MYIVISTIKLSLLIVLSLVYLLGLGWIVISPLLRGSLVKKRNNIRLIQEIPLVLTSGLIVNYGVALCFPNLRIGLIVGTILSVFGIGYFTLYVFQSYNKEILILPSPNIWLGISFISLLFLGPILTIPLEAWDARSIWFFHAKMIYFANTIGQSAGWQHPSTLFSHTDYPKLVPLLAAQVAYIAGFWNEYIPKTSLFIMLVPALIWLFNFARRTFSFIVLLMLVPFSFYMLMWNGYMDGFLALYFAIAMLFLGKYIKSSSSTDLLSGLGCLVVLLYIKNEGALALFAGLFSITLVLFSKRKFYSYKFNFSMNWKYYLAGPIALLPFFLWNFYKQCWNLSNDLGVGTIASFLRIINRLSDGLYRLILETSYKQLEAALLLLVFLYFASVIWRKTLVKESYPALIAAGVYYLGMVTVYLLTPADLSWHLRTSIARTMLPINAALFVASYYILNGIESSERNH